MSIDPPNLDPEEQSNILARAGQCTAVLYCYELNYDTHLINGVKQYSINTIPNISI